MDGIWIGGILGVMIWLALVVVLTVIGLSLKWSKKTHELLGAIAFFIVPIMMAKFAWEELKELPLPF